MDIFFSSQQLKATCVSRPGPQGAMHFLLGTYHAGRFCLPFKIKQGTTTLKQTKFPSLGREKAQINPYKCIIPNSTLEPKAVTQAKGLI